MIEIIESHVNDGNMSRKYSSDGYQNRMNFLKSHNIDKTKSTCLNIYNSDVIKYLGDDICELTDADALITDKKDIFMYLVFADCIPFILYDKKRNVLAFAHLGWNSVYLNLHKKLINKLIDDGSNAGDIKAILGPSIKKNSYIKVNPKQKDDSEWKKYVEYIGDDKYTVDIFNKVIDDIKEIGISNIHYDYIDTYSDEKYFSHLRSTIQKTDEGRFLYGVRMR